MCVNYFSGVDRGTSAQGASLSTSNRLSFAEGSLSCTGIRGITCCCILLFFFFNVILSDSEEPDIPIVHV